MYYPQSEVIALLWLLLGLAGGGTWPALRQAIKVVDFEVFNLVFIPSAAPARRSANRAQQGLADRKWVFVVKTPHIDKQERTQAGTLEPSSHHTRTAYHRCINQLRKATKL